MTAPGNHGSAGGTSSGNPLRASGARRTVRQFALFALVGTSGMVVGLGVLNLCMAIWPCFPVANVAAFLIAVTWNFILNQRYTFPHIDKPMHRQWFEFVIACLGGTAVNWTVAMGLYYGLEWFRDHFNCAALAGVVSACAVNFFTSKFYVFRSRPKPQADTVTAVTVSPQQKGANL